MKPKILLFDIENAPGSAYIWQLKNDYINPRMIKEEWYMLCWAAKWLGDKKLMSSALIDHKGYNPNKPCDKLILGKLWKLLDEADIVIAHNGKAFDCKKSNSRFIKHGITPPSPYAVIDTLTIARTTFLFMSNSLNELGKFLGVGAKVRTGGFDLWEDCMGGCPKAWKKMVQYCKQDVKLLEKVYLKMLPYIKSHPHVSVEDSIRYQKTQDNRGYCPRCGEDGLVKKRVRVRQTGFKQQYRCRYCKGYSEQKISGFTKQERFGIFKPC